MKEKQTNVGVEIFPFTDKRGNGHIQVFTNDGLLNPEDRQRIRLNLTTGTMYSYVESQQLILALQRAVEILAEERRKRLEKEA